MPRPKGSRTDDYVIGFMAGLLHLLKPSGGARELARLAIKLGQVPCGGLDANRVDRLARKVYSRRFRRDTEEWHHGLMLAKWMHANWALLDYYDTSECASFADLMKVTPRRKFIARMKFMASRRPK